MKAKIFFTSIALTAIAFIASAQPGILDNTFGTNGKVIFDSVASYSMAIQSDGKIVTAGNLHDSSNFFFAVARINNDGSVDSSFGVNGKAKISFDSCSVGSGSYSMVIQPDGKIIEAGYCYSFAQGVLVIALARLNSNGALDTSFGINGRVISQIDPYIVDFISNEPCQCALQTDGKIVVIGTAYTYYGEADFVLLRYNANGSPDTSFGGSGFVTTHVNYYNYAYCLAIQSDGKIIVAGAGEPYSGYFSGYLIARYNINGSLDSSFGFNGDGPNATYNTPTSVLVQPDGKIVASGISSGYYYGNYDFSLARYNSNGSLDTSFGTGGTIITDFDNWDLAYASLLQPNGKILIAGSSGGQNYSTKNFVLVRYSTDGTIDSSFGTNGIDTTDFGDNFNQATSLALQQDGKIVEAGLTLTYGYNSSAIARYKNDPVPCSANFTLYPDTSIPHHYWAVNMATGTPPLSYEWNWGDGSTDSIAFPSHTYASGGFYNICLTIQDSTGCTNNYCSYSQVQKMSSEESENTIVYIDVVSSIPTSVQNSDELQLLSMIPNPAHDQLTLNLLSQQSARSEIIIYDLLGRIVYHSMIDLIEGHQQFSIPVSAFENGMYELVIRNDHEIWKEKLIKQ